MSLSAVIGQATALDGREAAWQATRRALERMGIRTVKVAFIVASHDFPPEQVLDGVSSLLGEIPVWGFSTTSGLSAEGQSRRSVVVALMGGSDVHAAANWWPGWGQDGSVVAREMIQDFELEQAEGSLLIATDGLAGDVEQVCAALPRGKYTLGGCLAGGTFHGTTFQLGGKQAGSGGMAAAFLTGNFAAGVGVGLAWQPVGTYFMVGKTQGTRLLTLDDHPAAEAYAHLTGYQASEWAKPPLNELIRLYPLGLEQEGSSTLLVRSPIGMESDGSLQMGTTIPEGRNAYLLIGSAERYLQASRDAAQQALNVLGKARPVLALVFSDVAGQMLLEAQPGGEVEAVQSIVGADVPVIGGYTYGQIAHAANTQTPQLLNQHIEVIVFGEL